MLMPSIFGNDFIQREAGSGDCSKFYCIDESGWL